MGRWEEVGFLLHDWPCTVLFDTPKAPGVQKRYDGVISCPVAGAVPHLNNKYTNSAMMPPPWALVIIHTPEKPNFTW
jgi:hypothetical protein